MSIKSANNPLNTWTRPISKAGSTIKRSPLMKINCDNGKNCSHRSKWRAYTPIFTGPHVVSTTPVFKHTKNSSLIKERTHARQSISFTVSFIGKCKLFELFHSFLLAGRLRIVGNGSCHRIPDHHQQSYICNIDAENIVRIAKPIRSNTRALTWCPDSCGAHAAVPLWSQNSWASSPSLFDRQWWRAYDCGTNAVPLHSVDRKNALHNRPPERPDVGEWIRAMLGFRSFWRQ